MEIDNVLLSPNSIPSASLSCQHWMYLDYGTVQKIHSGGHFGILLYVVTSRSIRR